MAIPFGKLTFLVSVGIVTSVLAKEGRLSTVSDVVGGARKYGVIIVIVVAGYGYVWWKGWKLPDMMFATKRSLFDACNSVARQLEDVYLSISAAQRQLSSKITRVDRDVSKIVEISRATKEEESKLTVIEGKQKLCDFVWGPENDGSVERIQALRYSSSRAYLELPGVTPSARTGSLPPALPLELLSPSDSNGYQKVDRSCLHSVSDSGLKEFNGVLRVGESSRSPKVFNGIGDSEDISNWSSSSGLLGRRFSGSVLTRQRSATNAVAQQALSSGQQC